jgi:hypothetical protein
VLFNARVLMNNVERIADRLAQTYREPALIPAMPWLDSVPPATPQASIAIDSLETQVVRFEPADAKPLFAWLVQARVDGEWRTAILPAAERMFILPGPDAKADAISVIAVDRVGNLSPAAILRRTP